MPDKFVGAECGLDTDRHFRAMGGDILDLIRASLANPETFDQGRVSITPAQSEADPWGTRAYYEGSVWRRIGMGPWERV